MNQCSGICDAVPSNWRMSVDEAGCPVLVEIVPGRSCLNIRDARPDTSPEVQGDMSDLQGDGSDLQGDMSIDERD